MTSALHLLSCIGMSMGTGMGLCCGQCRSASTSNDYHKIQNYNYTMYNTNDGHGQAMVKWQG